MSTDAERLAALLHEADCKANHLYCDGQRCEDIAERLIAAGVGFPAEGLDALRDAVIREAIILNIETPDMGDGDPMLALDDAIQALPESEYARLSGSSFVPNADLQSEAPAPDTSRGRMTDHGSGMVSFDAPDPVREDV